MLTWHKAFDALMTSNVFKASGRFVLGAAIVSVATIVSHVAMAQRVTSTDNATAFVRGMIDHAQKMRQFTVTGDGTQTPPSLTQIPPSFPQVTVTPDSTGQLETYQLGGRTFTSVNAFFQSLGTNGRTCFSCHQPQEGWTVSAAGVAQRFTGSNGTDPIFRLVDGAVCPTADVSTLDAKRQAYKLVIEKGLIRIGLPIPATAEFYISDVQDPYNCNTNPTTGFTTDPVAGTTTGIISVYRRPLPTTNLGFLSTVMWDGRENISSPFDLDTNLRHQAIDATLVHAQAATPPTDEQVNEMLAFEKGLFTAQISDNNAGSLTAANAKGGPVNLSLEIANFFLGVNDPFPGGNPKGIAFTCKIFSLYLPWLGAAPGNCGDFNGASITSASAPKTTTVSTAKITTVPTTINNQPASRQSVARGEELFNNTPIAITGVAGINDALGVDTLNGFCGTCHDTPNVGNHSVAAPLDIGIPDAGALAPPVVDISGLPVFTLVCNRVADTDPNKAKLQGRVIQVTDPGRALITGRCRDIGKLKGPILRGLAARAPYFHNGSAKTLLDAVNFYDQRFHIGFTDQQKTDLVNFLNTL
jgi:cytochrome c peroxidase